MGKRTDRGIIYFVGGQCNKQRWINRNRKEGDFIEIPLYNGFNDLEEIYKVYSVDCGKINRLKAILIDFKDYQINYIESL